MYRVAVSAGRESLPCTHIMSHIRVVPGMTPDATEYDSHYSSPYNASVLPLRLNVRTIHVLYT